MRMPSKFPGKCKTCGKPYRAGEEIEWTKEDGARHIQCAQGSLLEPDSADYDALADQLGFLPRADAVRNCSAGKEE